MTMTAFTFDTSGVVYAPRPGAPQYPDAWMWEHLSPFVQGFVKRLFATFREQLLREASFKSPALKVDELCRFDRLSPDALALILRDCERWCSQKTRGAIYTNPQSSAAGRSFWAMRSHPHFLNGVSYPEGFPPLRPFLTDEGKIALEEVK